MFQSKTHGLNHIYCGTLGKRIGIGDEWTEGLEKAVPEQDRMTIHMERRLTQLPVVWAALD